jgi:hypothetical protein
MNPAAINALLQASRSLHLRASEGSPNDVVPAFVGSWVAWEALRTRFIRVVIHHQGWSLKDADNVLARAKISSMDRAASVIESLHIKNPHQWPGVSAKAWRLLCAIEPLRHRLVHGFKTVDPIRVKTATSLVLFLVENHQWLESVPLVDAKKKKDRILVGSLLGSRRAHSIGDQRKVEELASKLQLNLTQGSKRLPSVDQLTSAIESYGA